MKFVPVDAFASQLGFADLRNKHKERNKKVPRKQAEMTLDGQRKPSRQPRSRRFPFSSTAAQSLPRRLLCAATHRAAQERLRFLELKVLRIFFRGYETAAAKLSAENRRHNKKNIDVFF